jgi:hypothetical protein
MKFVLISFLSFYILVTLAPNMQGAQYLKVGEMYSHFEKDYSEKGISFSSFLDFLEEHYTKKLDLSKDGHKDLPFKTIGSSSVQLSFHEYRIEAVFECEYLFEEKNTSFPEPSFSNKGALFSIWNPPRI